MHKQRKIIINMCAIKIGEDRNWFVSVWVFGEGESRSYHPIGGVAAVGGGRTLDLEALSHTFRIRFMSFITFIRAQSNLVVKFYSVCD